MLEEALCRSDIVGVLPDAVADGHIFDVGGEKRTRRVRQRLPRSIINIRGFVAWGDGHMLDIAVGRRTRRVSFLWRVLRVLTCGVQDFAVGAGVLLPHAAVHSCRCMPHE